MCRSDSFGRIHWHGDGVVNQVEYGVTHTVETFDWFPPERYARHLPPSFSIRFQRWLGSDGIRRYLPQDGGWSSLIFSGFTAGIAIRQELDLLPESQRLNAKLQFFASQWMMERQEFLKRRFRYGRDIYIRTNSRIDQNERNVLTDLSFLHPGLKSVSAVREMAEVEKKEPSLRFHDGLYRIAREIDPSSIIADNLDYCLRQSLLAHKVPLPSLSERELEEVNARLFQLLNKKFDLQASDFTDWLTATKTNLPTRISRLSKRQNIDYAVAKAGLFELGWRGMQQLSICINATMRTIQNALGDLNSDEERIYSSLYLSQPELAGFVPLQFLDRFDFLKPALVDCWNGSPSEEVMPALANLLYIYGRMAETRRTSDRTSSRNRIARNNLGSATTTIQIHENMQSNFNNCNSDFQKVLLDTFHLGCDHSGTNDRDLSWKIESNGVQFAYRCKNCAVGSKLFCTYDELKQKLVPKDFLQLR